MSLEEHFALTAEEQTRLEAASFRNTDADGWRNFAGQAQAGLLGSYAGGEIDLRRALELMRACSLGCATKDRIVLIANMVEQALRITPADLKSRRPPHPTWLKASAAALVELLHDTFPDQPIAPNDGNDWTTPVLETAIAWLAALGLTTAPIRPRTLYEWYRQYPRA